MAYVAGSGPSVSQYLNLAKQLANMSNFIPGMQGYGGMAGGLLGLGQLWASDAPDYMKLGNTFGQAIQSAPNIVQTLGPQLAPQWWASQMAQMAPQAAAEAGTGAAGAGAGAAGGLSGAAMSGLAMLPFSAFMGGGPFRMILPDHTGNHAQLMNRARRTREAMNLQGDLLGNLGNPNATLRDFPDTRSGDALLSILEGNLSGDWFGTAHSWLPDLSFAPQAKALRAAGYVPKPVDTGRVNSWGEMIAGAGGMLMPQGLLMSPDEELRRFGGHTAVPRNLAGGELGDTAQQGAYGWSSLLGGNPGLVVDTKGFGPYRNYFDTQQTIYPEGVRTDGGYTPSQTVDTPFAGYMQQLKAYDPNLYAKVDQMNTAKRMDFEAMQQAWNGAP